MLIEEPLTSDILKIMHLQDKLVESSSKASIPSVTPLNVTAYSVMTNHRNGSDRMSCEGQFIH